MSKHVEGICNVRVISHWICFIKKWTYPITTYSKSNKVDFSNRIFWSWPNRSWPSMICCMRRKIRLRRNKKKKKEKFSRVVRGVCNGVLFLFELLLLFFLKWETGTVINGLSDWRKKISFMTWRRDGTRDQTRAKTTFEKKKIKNKKNLMFIKEKPRKTVE
jgi:hypothetical protein